MGSLAPVFGVLVAAALLLGAYSGHATSTPAQTHSITKPLDSKVSREKSSPARSRVFEDAAELSDFILLPAPGMEEFDFPEPGLLEKSALRVGIVRDVPGPYEVSERVGARWSRMRDATKVWAVMVQSEGAKGMRVNLAGAHLPKGTRIMVTSLANPHESVGPYEAKAILAAGDNFWTETIFSDAVVLECQVPPHVDEGEVAFDIARVAHLFVPLSDLMRQARVGNCHNDVTCADSDWRHAGNGVAGIGSIGQAGWLWCTGTLLNNTASDFIDYFLTARHCVRNQSEADSTEYYWFYQSSFCNGSVPHPATVPRTGGGAVFLAGRSRTLGSDFALLRLRQSTPGGVTYVGWTAAQPGLSAPVRGIHHPDGSFKRISYGSITGQPGNYWRVVWSSGVTEPGSSGSPLFNASRQVVGQLWGGSSSCSSPSGPDEYGRFDVTFPLVSEWLDPGQEPEPGIPNDDFADAVALGGTSGRITATNVGATKESGEPNHAGNAGGRSVWWRWTAPANGQATFDTFGSNFDTLLAVYTGGSLGALSLVAANDDAGGGLQSRVSFTAVAGVVYRIAVDGYGGASGNITLNWTFAGGEAADVIRVNSGGSGAGEWLSDRGHVGRSATYRVSRDIRGAGNVPQAVWRSVRAVRLGRQLNYSFADIPPGPHLVRLHFSDPVSARTGFIRFHVDLEGIRVLSNFDVFRAAGGRDRALIREFPVTVDGNGLQLRFTPTRGAAFINGIEIVSQGAASKPAAQERAFLRPIGVWSSGDWDDGHGARRAVDNDPSTAWIGDAGADRWWLAWAYERVLAVEHVRVMHASDSVPHTAVVGSRDGRTWFPVGDVHRDEPAYLRYVWIRFSPLPEERGRVPRVVDIAVDLAD